MVSFIILNHHGKKIMGIRQFESEYKMLEYYINNQFKYYKDEYGGNFLKDKTLILRFNKHDKFGLTPMEYMNTIYNNSVMVINEFE